MNWILILILIIIILILNNNFFAIHEKFSTNKLIQYKIQLCNGLYLMQIPNFAVITTYKLVSDIASGSVFTIDKNNNLLEFGNLILSYENNNLLGGSWTGDMLKVEKITDTTYYLYNLSKKMYIGVSNDLYKPFTLVNKENACILSFLPI